MTRKISRAVAEIKAGRQRELYLGNLDARRDWGYAPEYVVAMWKILQQDQPEDFVIGTGISASVRDFLSFSFAAAGLNWEEFVRFDERYLRPTEVNDLCADASKARSRLDWMPTVSVEMLAQEMVRHDIAADQYHLVDRPIGKLWSEETGK